MRIFQEIDLEAFDRLKFGRNRSTWAKVTRHLWTPEELQHYVDQVRSRRTRP